MVQTIPCVCGETACDLDGRCIKCREERLHMCTNCKHFLIGMARVECMCCIHNKELPDNWETKGESI